MSSHHPFYTMINLLNCGDLDVLCNYAPISRLILVRSNFVSFLYLDITQCFLPVYCRPYPGNL